MRIGFYDLETKKSPAKVGWRNYIEMGISTGCIYINDESKIQKKYCTDPMKLVEELNQLDKVVGFNNYNFDDNLISTIAGKDQEFILNSFDMLAYITHKTGIKYCVNLDNLSKATINDNKTPGMSGKDVPEFYEKGKIKQIQKYCMQDCKLLHDVYMFGVKYGYVLIPPNKGKMFGDMYLRIPVNWKMK